MKKYFNVSSAKIFFIATAVFAVCSLAYAGIRHIPNTNAPLSASILETARTAQKQEQDPRLEHLSIEEKIGQRIMVGIPSTELDKETKDFITEINAGGVLLLDRNVKDSEQLQKLTGAIHDIYKEQNDRHIIIAIDQEGGVVSRITFPQSDTTAQKDISKESDAYMHAYARGKELASYGIDMNFSPVMDYITDPKSFLYERTFRAEPEKIAMLGGAMLRGYEDAKIIPVIKHFPGHTNSSSDTHTNVPIVQESEELLASHMAPFKSVIERFSPSAVMVGGTTYASLDGYPGALSFVIIQKLLRQQMRFEGMVISDDLEMGAFSTFPLQERALRALQAGNDMIIFSETKNSREEIRHAVLFLVQAAKEGLLDEHAMNESVSRILNLR